MTVVLTLNLWHAVLCVQVLGMAWALYRLHGVTQLFEPQAWRHGNAFFMAVMLVVMLVLVVIWPLGILASYFRGPV